MRGSRKGEACSPSLPGCTPRTSSACAYRVSTAASTAGRERKLCSSRGASVAVSMAAFEPYYQGEAETWELLALTRARVVWATSDAFRAEAEKAIEATITAANCR